jgi:hypothetical protein
MTDLKSLRNICLIMYFSIYILSFGILFIWDFRSIDYYRALIGILILSAFSVFTFLIISKAWFLRNEKLGLYGTVFFFIGTILGMILIIIEAITSNINILIGLPFFASVCLISFYQLKFMDNTNPEEYKKQKKKDKENRDKSKIVI